VHSHLHSTRFIARSKRQRWPEGGGLLSSWDAAVISGPPPLECLTLRRRKLLLDGSGLGLVCLCAAYDHQTETG